MSSIAIIEAVNTTSLPFHGQHIITAMAAGVAYVAMKPIVENLGMSWSTQQTKLMKQIEKFNCVHMNMVAADKRLRQLLCIPLHKLNGWLFSINPAKVRDDIRDRLVRYQEECFTALHDYWTKGAAIRKPETTVDDRTPLRGIVNRIMGKYGMTYQAVYRLVHKEFGVNHIDELTAKQTAEAVEYLAGKVIEGDFIGKNEKHPEVIKEDIGAFGAGHRYRARVIIYDDMSGSCAEMIGKASTMRDIAWGIANDLGFRPNGMTHLPAAMNKLKRIY